jgi:hypothetical protein
MPFASAGMRRHVHAGNHAAESFVSFIPLFDRMLHPPAVSSSLCLLQRLDAN